jgi:hypothetical protein
LFKLTGEDGKRLGDGLKQSERKYLRTANDDEIFFALEETELRGEL